MHQNTKLTPVLRKELYTRWKTGKYSQRELGVMYHVDKKVVARVIERGKKGDFSVHTSTNARFVKGKEKKGK